MKHLTVLFLITLFLPMLGREAIAASPHIYYMVESLDGLQLTYEMNKENSGTDIALGQSDWHCFFAGVRPGRGEFFLALDVRCISVGHADVSFFTTLEVMKGDTMKVIDFTLISAKNQFDHRVRVMFSSTALPKSFLTPKRVPVE